MFRKLIALTGLAALAACGDPLAEVPRLAEVDVDAPSPVVEAIAAPMEADTRAGFFQRLMRKRELPDPVETPADPAPLPPAQSLADPAPDANPDPAAVPPKSRRFWPFARKPAPGAVAGTGAESARVDAPPRKPGLFARRSDPNPPQPETVRSVSLTPKVAPDSKQSAAAGLFSRQKAARLTGPSDRDVTPGEVLAFGDIGRACGLKRGQLGREVAKYPERSARYRLFDSAPGNQDLHSFYLTGFSDGCPRQFTAALAVFGSASMHEMMRYGLPDKARPWSVTDKAYEKIKGKVCGQGRRKPCGKSIGRLEKGTVFLSVYNRFEGADGWNDILLHDGTVVALDRKLGLAQ